MTGEILRVEKKSCSEIFKFEVILRDVNLAVGNTFLDFKERKRLEI